jgi:hypothetical protein
VIDVLPTPLVTPAKTILGIFNVCLEFFFYLN